MSDDIENLKKLRSFHNGSYAKSIDNAIKALEFQHKMQYGNCDYCKYKKNDSNRYQCCVCGDTAKGYFEMWEEAKE